MLETLWQSYLGHFFITVLHYFKLMSPRNKFSLICKKMKPPSTKYRDCMWGLFDKLLWKVDMRLFIWCKYKAVFRTQSNIHDTMEVFAKIVNSFHPLTIFAKKLHHRCLSGFSMCLLNINVQKIYILLHIFSFLWKQYNLPTDMHFKTVHTKSSNFRNWLRNFLEFVLPYI